MRNALGTIFFVLLGIVLIVVIGVAAFKETKRMSAIDKEIAVLEEEARMVKQDNMKLTDRIAYFNTEAYQERIAKEKMNLQKEGENVVVITKRPKEIVLGDTKEKIEEEAVQEDLPNYVKWWQVFFP